MTGVGCCRESQYRIVVCPLAWPRPAGVLILLIIMIMSCPLTRATCTDQPVDNVPNSQQCEITNSEDFNEIKSDVSGLSLVFEPQHTIDFTQEGLIPFLPKLNTLKMDLTNVNSQLGEGLFVQVNQLEKLTMSKSYTRPGATPTILPDRLFKDLRDLATLTLTYMNIETIQAEALRDLFKLRILDIGNNVIKTIPHNTFVDCNNLYSIIMYKNRIEDFGLISFAGLQSLEILNLAENNVKIIKPDQLRDLSGLRELNIEYSSVTQIELGAFSGVSKLDTLYLDGNRLTQLAPNGFQGLTNLHTLHINENPITRIDDAFLGLGELLELKLKNTNISAISSASFSGLTSLDLLDLQNNHLEMLTNNQAFKHLDMLNELNLEGNGLHYLHEDGFEGLGQLKKLDLSYNSLTMLPNGLLNHVPALESIRLVGNRWDCSEVSELSRWYNLKLQEAGNCEPETRADVFEDGREVTCHKPDNTVTMPSVVGMQAHELCVLALTTVSVVVDEEDGGLGTGVKIGIIIAAVVLALLLVLLVVLLVLCRTKKHGMWTPTKKQTKTSSEDSLRYKARGKTATKTPSVYWDGEAGPTAMDQMDHAYMNHAFSNSAIEGDDSLAPKHRGAAERIEADIAPPSYDVAMKHSTASVGSLEDATGYGESSMQHRNHKGGPLPLKHRKGSHVSCDTISDLDPDDNLTSHKLDTDRMHLEMKMPLDSVGRPYKSEQHASHNSVPSYSGKEKYNAAYMQDSHGDDNVFVDGPDEDVRAVHRRKSWTSDSEQGYLSDNAAKAVNTSTSYLPPKSPTNVDHTHVCQDEGVDNSQNEQYEQDMSY